MFSTENTHVLLIVVSLSQTSSIKDGMVHARSPNRASEDISPGLDSKFISVPGNNGTHDVPGHFGKEAVQSTDITDPPVWLKNLILALQGGTNFRVLKWEHWKCPTYVRDSDLGVDIGKRAHDSEGSGKVS